MMEHLSTLFYRLLMHSSICILEEFNFFLFIYFILLKKQMCVSIAILLKASALREDEFLASQF